VDLPTLDREVEVIYPGMTFFQKATRLYFEFLKKIGTQAADDLQFINRKLLEEKL